MSDFFMNGNWLLNLLVKHIWHGCVVGTLALALVYTVCRLFPRMSPDTTSWLYRLGYLKLIAAFVFIGAISLPLIEHTHISPASTVVTSIQVSSHKSVLTVSTARSTVPPDAVLYFMMLWGAGVIAASIRIGFASYKTRILRESCSKVEDEQLHETLTDLCQQMGIRRPPELLSGNVNGPMICGFLSPSIILPEVSLADSSEYLRLVLAHELAHVKRRDVMWAWLPMLAQWFFFFNPLVWLLRREWFFAQEAACDLLAIEATSASHAEYGRMLLDHVVPVTASRRLVAIGVSEPYHTLKRRLNAMLKSQSGSQRNKVLVGVIVLVIGIAAIIPWAMNRNQLPTLAPKNGNSSNRIAITVAKAVYSNDVRTFQGLWSDGTVKGNFVSQVSQEVQVYGPVKEVVLAASDRIVSGPDGKGETAGPSPGQSSWTVVGERGSYILGIEIQNGHLTGCVYNLPGRAIGTGVL